jgi:Lipocalin-like domain
VVSEATNSSSEAAERFLGAWRYVEMTVDGKPGTTRGTNPKGILIYDASGHMAVHVAPDSDATATNHTAYFGTWSIDAQAATVTHYKDGRVQPDDGEVVVRGYTFAGDRLIYRPLEATTNIAIIWERIK